MTLSQEKRNKTTGNTRFAKMPVVLRGQETDKMKQHHFGKAIGNRHICKSGTLCEIAPQTLGKINGTIL